MAFDSGGTNTYTGKTLDTYLNTTWYNALAAEAKNAIVPKNITQYQYSFNSSVCNATTHASYADYSTKALKAEVGERYVYALDVEDVENYFNNTFSTADIWTLFWNTKSQPSNSFHVRLRSADSDHSNYAWFVLVYGGNVNSNLGVGNTIAVRAAFQIDLSKIPFTIGG